MLESQVREPVEQDQAGAAGRPAEELQGELTRLRAALEDIISLAHTSGEARSRVAQMERRAMAALARRDLQPLTRPHELARVPRRPER